MATMELGGNIELVDFDQTEPGQLVVVKKVVGNYAKKISTIKEFSKIAIILSKKDEKFNIQTKLTISDNIYTTDAADANLFFALDKALATLITEIK